MVQERPTSPPAVSRCAAGCVQPHAASSEGAACGQSLENHGGQLANAVPEQYRQSIYELAISLAVIDKELEGREPEVVTHLWRSLGLDETLARKLFMDRIEHM